MLKLILKILAGLVAALLVFIFIIFFIGQSKVAEKYEVTADFISVTSNDSIIAHGEHLAKVSACTDCHNSSLSGQIIADAPPFLITASNLTSGKGGMGNSYTDADWDRAIRYGVKPDGSPIMIMPTKTYHNFSDEDANALIAYLKSVPPVDNELPQKEMRFLGNIIAGMGGIDLAGEVHLTANRDQAPEADSTAAYGKYLTSTTCIYCHQPGLVGGPDPRGDDPAALDFIPGLERVTVLEFEEFETIMRTGMLPEGRKVDSFMPVKAFKHYNNMELKAIYTYINSLDF